MGREAFIIENNRKITKRMIIREERDFYIVSFGAGSGVRLRKKRVYFSEDEAKKHIHKETETRYRPPYMH